MLSFFCQVKVECNVLVISIDQLSAASAAAACAIDQLSAASAAAACAAAAPCISVARCMSQANLSPFAAVDALAWLPP